jgi:hypothetical protein
MKKLLSILSGALIVVFISFQFAVAAVVDTSNSSEEVHIPTTVKHSSINTATFLTPAVIHAYYANSFFASGFNSDKRQTAGLSKSLMSLTTIPLFISPGIIKKTAFLVLSKEKVVFGAPSHKRFSYPAIAFRIKF